jgi:bifunctional DNase/RNase
MTATMRIAMSGCLALAIAGAPGRAEPAPGPAPAVAPRPGDPQEARIIGVVIDPRTQAPAVVLEGTRDHRRLAMLIGVAEATGIAVPLHGITPPRPLTHDLLLTLLTRLEVSVRRVLITDLVDDVYYATLLLHGARGELTLDARPSDAIALAVRAKAPVLIEDRVFDKAPRSSIPAEPPI